MQKNVSVGERDGVPLHLVDYQHIKSDPRFARVIAELKTFDPRALHLTWIIHEICSKLILAKQSFLEKADLSTSCYFKNFPD